MIPLRSKTTQKLLNLFFLNEKERFYVNELAGKIKEYPANVHKTLIALKTEGILADEFMGKERYFFLNSRYPFLKEYKKIILKGVGFEKILKEELKKIKGLEAVYLFGSYAKNRLSAESDIDILIIGRADMIKLQRGLLKIQKITGREINSIELTKEEFNQKKKKRDAFLADIFAKKHIKIL